MLQETQKIRNYMCRYILGMCRPCQSNWCNPRSKARFYVRMLWWIPTFAVLKPPHRLSIVHSKACACPWHVCTAHICCMIVVESGVLLRSCKLSWDGKWELERSVLAVVLFL